MSTKALSVVVATVVALLMVDSAAAAPADWWNNSWHYRVNVTINTSAYNRTDWPIEQAINFTDIGLKGTFDNNSVRVIEYNSTEDIVGEIISQFDKGANYDNTTNAYGEVVWLLNGTRPNNTLVYYYIYFDSTEWGLKPAPNYPSALNFTTVSSEEFEVNNTNLSVRIHTNFGVNRTSGMRFAQFIGGPNIFDVASGETIEYIKYNGSAKSLWYDFRNNFQVEHSGPVRIIVKQEGDEMEWGTTNPTTEGNMTKKYTFYRNNTWIKIDQTFTSTSSVFRRSEQTEALHLDMGRTEIFNGPGDIQSDFNDPFSYAAAFKTGLGMGIINLNESASGDDTPFYRAEGNPANKIMGITIWNSIGTLTNGESVSETAAVYFHQGSNKDPVLELRKRFMNDTTITLASVEERTVDLIPQSDFDIYNRNETVFITGNVSQDIYNLSYSANATITDSSGVNISVNLTKNGTIYEGNYTIGIGDELGVWNLTVRTYDDNGYLLNETAKSFNVTNVYVVDINILNPIALVNLSVYANITVKTFRDDKGIPGIAWPNISCSYYNASNASQVTYLTDSNISEAVTGFGNYTANWTVPKEGSWNVSCNATRFNNSGTDNVTFLTTVKNTTTLNLTLNTTTYNVSFVKWNTNQTFAARFNVTNIDLGFAEAVNLTVNFSDAGWWVSNISNPYQCGDILPLDSCIIDFEITVPNRTNPGLYNVYANVTWENFIGTINSTSDWFNVTVDSNPVLETTTPSINLPVSEDSTQQLNFTVFSAGNAQLDFINYSCTSIGSAVCSNFTPVFSQQNISNFVAGDATNITMNFTIPDGQPPGTHIGNVTLYSGNQTVNVTISLTVRESRNWTVNDTTCFKPALPNRTGDVCELEIDNTGNVDLTFNITPSYNATYYLNYTYANETYFTVLANTSKTILFKYNTTTTSTNQTNITIYNINATDPLADPDFNTTTVTLDIVYGPDLDFFNITPIELAQLDNLTINVTITDRLWIGYNLSNIWVSANISWPNGTLIETVNLTNDTILTPGATSNWSLDYNNTKYRGINFSVTVFSQDRLGGYVESTSEKNFTVYAKLSLVVNPTRPSNRYDPGDNLYVRVFANDSNFEELDGVNFTIYLMDAVNNNATKFNLLTSGGTAVTQTAYNIYEGVIGDWKLVTYASYYDAVADKNITANITTTFKVDYVKEVTVQTDATHYRGTSFPVKVFITQEDENGVLSLVNVSENVTVRLSFDGSTIQSVIATLYGDYYEATMSLAADATPGAYLAKVTAYDGGTNYEGFTPFDVPATPIKSLTLDLNIDDVYEPGDVVTITAFLSDQDSNYINDSTINLTITDPNNNATVLNMTAITTTSPPKYTANYTIPDNGTLGIYTLFGNVSYAGVYTSAVKVFVVSEILFTQIAIDPVVYLNESMNITITVINPITSQGIDPDEMTLTLYNTSNGTIEVWKTLNKSDFTPGASAGVFSYSEILDPNATASGSYSAILEVKEGSFRVWGMETFKIQPRLVYDVIIESITDPLPSGGTLQFTVNITNMGEFVPNADVVVSYWIDDGTQYSGSEPREIKQIGESDVFTKSFASVNLPDGIHLLFVRVSYQGVAVATASKTFEIGAGAPPAPPSGPIGGGGAAPPSDDEEAGIAKLSIVEFYPSEVHVERGGLTYLVASVENLGGTTLTDITAEVSGIPEDWYELIKGEVDSLGSGETSDVLIQIKIPQSVSAQAVTLTVKAISTEVTYERSLVMRIFSSREDLVYFEIESVKKTMRNSEDRALRALNEGKNVSEVMTKIDEARMEIRQAENFLSQSEHENALGHLDNAREVLEHVNELLEFLRLTEAPVPPPVPTPEPGLGISTPILMFMFFVIAALAGMVVFLARDQITGVLGNITTAPTVKKTRARRASPEVLSQANNLREEIANTERLLGTMKGQHDAGLISDSTYKELKKRNDDKIKLAKSKLKDLGV